MKSLNRTIIVILLIIVVLSGCSDKKQIVKRTEAEFNIFTGINMILNSGKKVSLYIHLIISEKGCSSIEGKGKEADSAAMNNITGTFSQQLLKRFSGRAGFSLIDRGQVPALMKELQMDQAGLLGEEVRNRIGKLLSVNYIIQLSHVTSCVNIDMTESSTYRFIELETGRIVSIDKVEVKKHYNDTMEKWETDGIKLNRREVTFDEEKQGFYY